MALSDKSMLIALNGDVRRDIRLQLLEGRL
jgi:hypothetical protein